MNKDFMKWTMFISFVVLLVGGLNYLLMGLLSFDMFGEIFGDDTVAGRVIYCVFGAAAIILAATVIWKCCDKNKEKQTKTTKKSS